MIPSSGVRFGHALARRASCGIRGSDAGDDPRDGLPHELDVRVGDPVVERRRGLVGRDRHLDLADDRAGVGGRIGDLEQRHARSSRGR